MVYRFSMRYYANNLNFKNYSSTFIFKNSKLQKYIAKNTSKSWPTKRLQWKHVHSCQRQITLIFKSTSNELVKRRRKKTLKGRSLNESHDTCPTLPPLLAKPKARHIYLLDWVSLPSKTLDLIKWCAPIFCQNYVLTLRNVMSLSIGVATFSGLFIVYWK